LTLGLSQFVTLNQPEGTCGATAGTGKSIETNKISHNCTSASQLKYVELWMVESSLKQSALLLLYELGDF